MRAFSDNLIFSVLLLIVQILSFASGVAALAGAASICFSREPFPTAVSPANDDVDELVTVATTGVVLACAAVEVDVDECGSKPASVDNVAAVAAAVNRGGDLPLPPPIAGTGLDWATLEMIMSLRVTGVEVAVPVAIVSSADSDDAFRMSGSFLALNKRMVRSRVEWKQFGRWLRHH